MKDQSINTEALYEFNFKILILAYLTFVDVCPEVAANWLAKLCVQ